MCVSVSAYVCLCVCVYAKAPNALAVDLNVSAIFVHLSITNQFHTIAHLTYWRRPRLVLSSSCPSTLCAGAAVRGRSLTNCVCNATRCRITRLTPLAYKLAHFSYQAHVCLSSSHSRLSLSRALSLSACVCVCVCYLSYP